MHTTESLCWSAAGARTGVPAQPPAASLQPPAPDASPLRAPGQPVVGPPWGSPGARNPIPDSQGLSPAGLAGSAGGRFVGRPAVMHAVGNTRSVDVIGGGSVGGGSGGIGSGGVANGGGQASRDNGGGHAMQVDSSEWSECLQGANGPSAATGSGAGAASAAGVGAGFGARPSAAATASAPAGHAALDPKPSPAAVAARTPAGVAPVLQAALATGGGSVTDAGPAELNANPKQFAAAWGISEPDARLPAAGPAAEGSCLMPAGGAVGDPHPSPAAAAPGAAAGLVSEGESVVQVVFGGLLRSDVTCCVCGFTSTAHDPFLDISLDLHAPPTRPPPLLRPPAPAHVNKYARLACFELPFVL